MNQLLKWPGSKRRLAAQIVSEVSGHLGPNGRFVELFTGSAAVFFRLEPRRAVLVDVNKPLMAFYEAIRREPAAVHEELQLLMALPFCEETFNQMKVEWNGRDFGVRFAARFLYLNRTCFNGLFRLNRNLGFNVAWGKKEKLPKFPSKEEFKEASRLLLNATLYAKGYEDVLRATHAGDAVYADPPYWGKFDRYAGSSFTARDQRKLAKMLRRAASRGVSIFASNVDCAEVQGLYSSWAKVHVVPVHHKIGASNGSRRVVDEVLISATPPFVDPRQMTLFSNPLREEQ